MAQAIHDWVFKGILSSLLISLLAAKVLGTEGVCTRNEIVSKTRTRSAYKTYLESYWGWCQYSRYSWDKYQCVKQRQEGHYVNVDEDYTELETKQFCCTGYSQVNDCGSNSCPLKCAPVCDFTCSNGECTAPNYCKCNTGYAKKPGTENICEPVCSQECVNGYCSRPEFCSCSFGYEHNSSVSTSPYVCSPVCSVPCINADCTSPNVCSCFQGFAKTINERHRCHAQCSLPCHNGVCTSPDECTCFEGYMRGNSTWNVCNPVCTEECTNGTCTAPDECTCFDNFQKIEKNTCEPVCSQGCLNGLCIGPEICLCLSGYESYLDDPYSCFPVCSPACVNSNCTDPDRCECYSGFEETDNPAVCRPYCSDGCENGVCFEPEECACLWGFQSEGNASNCTRREGENLDCAFVTEIVNNDFDEYCFTLDSQLILQGLQKCNILLNLVVRLKRENNSKTLDLFCDGVSDLKLLKNRFRLQLECTVKLNSIEGKSSQEEFLSTSAYTEDQDIDSTFESTTQVSSSETLFRTDVQISSDFNETEIMLYNDNQSDNRNKNEEQGKFDITYDEIPSKTTELSDIPLNLNITIKFFTLISSLQMTGDYFDNVTTFNDDWCLCHQHQKNWSICAFTPVHLRLCPCEPKNLQIQVKESKSDPILKTVAKSVIISVITALVVCVIYSKLRSGSYDTSGTNDTISSSRPTLSFHLDNVDGSTRGEHMTHSLDMI